MAEGKIYKVESVGYSPAEAMNKAAKKLLCLMADSLKRVACIKEESLYDYVRPDGCFEQETDFSNLIGEDKSPWDRLKMALELHGLSLTQHEIRRK